MLAVLAVQTAVAAVLPVPALSGRVVDTISLLSAPQQSALEAKLTDLEARKGSQIVVLLVATTQPEAIEQYSLRVVEAWQPVAVAGGGRIRSLVPPSRWQRGAHGPSTWPRVR